MSRQVPEKNVMASLILVTVNISASKLNAAHTFTSTVAVIFMLILNYTKRYPLRPTILAVFALALPK